MEETTRTRRSRKRRFKVVPKMPVPVKALWEGASEEQRKAAHETCATILELWLGKTTRKGAAERMKVPPLRVWQLSQQALAGMVAGLLKQPRWRKAAMMERDPEDRKALRRRVLELERESRVRDDLIALLRELPAHREKASEEGTGKPHAVRGPTTKASRPPGGAGAGPSDAPGGKREARDA